MRLCTYIWLALVCIGNVLLSLNNSHFYQLNHLLCGRQRDFRNDVLHAVLDHDITPSISCLNKQPLNPNLLDSPVDCGLRKRLSHIRRIRFPPKTNVFDITLNHLIMMFLSWRFCKYRVYLHWHFFQMHSVSVSLLLGLWFCFALYQPFSSHLTAI